MMRAALAFLAALAAAAPARADAPPEVLAAIPGGPTQLGEERVTYWGFSLYTAELFALDRRFDFADPFALSLTYAREFTAAELAESSVDEMARISDRPPDDLSGMEGTLEGCFADVREGDRITGVSHGVDRASFFYNGLKTCEVAFPEFARLFFGIWLGDETRDARARDRLLGRR